MKKTGLVLEGGAFRGLFTAGVLDYLAEKQITFPYIVGVSSGAVNAVGYLSGQIGQMHRVISGGTASRYYGISGIGQLQNNPVQALFDYSAKQEPYDIESFLSSESECEFVLTDCESGTAIYKRPEHSEEDVVCACRAACAVPLLCEPVKIDGKYYLDGGISDAIPVERALTKCERAVVVLTRPAEEEPTDYAKMAFLTDICYRDKYPRLADALLGRYQLYRKEMHALSLLEKQGRVMVIRPTLRGIHHFESDREKTEEFYRHGYACMEEQYEKLEAFLEECP